MEFVDIVFVPKVIAKQLALAVALQTGMVRSWPWLSFCQHPLYSLSPSHHPSAPTRISFAHVRSQ